MEFKRGNIVVYIGTNGWRIKGNLAIVLQDTSLNQPPSPDENTTEVQFLSEGTDMCRALTCNLQLFSVSKETMYHKTLK